MNETLKSEDVVRITNEQQTKIEAEFKLPTAELPELIITQQGVFAIQVCTTLTDYAEISKQANAKCLCGTTGGWQVEEGRNDQGGQCADHPGRKHYILVA